MTVTADPVRAVDPAAANTADLPPIVYGFLGDGYGKGLGRQGGLPDALAELTPVVLLERSRYRPKRLLDVRRPRVERVGANMYVVHDAFSLRFSRLGKRLGPPAGWVDGHWLNAALDRAGLGGYAYWLTEANPAMLWGMRTDRLVYDCIDPCFQPEFQAAFDRREFAIARRARAVFATAQTLAERMRRANPRVHLLPNACATDTVAETAAHDPPAALAGRPRPVIGCMGTYDWRVDAEILYGAAKLLPDYTFALVGRVNRDQEGRMAGLRGLPNVIVTGAVSYEDGHRWAAAFDVGLIPFLPGEMCDAINPVKMYMYLVTGKPVVSTWINECVRHGDWVYAARDAAGFAAAIRKAVAEDGPDRRAARVAFGLRNRWQDRAAAAAGVLRSTFAGQKSGRQAGAGAVR